MNVNLGTNLFVLLVIVGVAVATYQDALSRGWDGGSAILMAIGVCFGPLVFFPIYLFNKNKPTRRKIALAVSRSIARQSRESDKDITIDALEIAREIGVSKPEIVRELLYQSEAQGELPTGVRII
ncbi:hypothetical protein H6F44_15320 [Pseudanabaena sp. FACHB-1277]|uniref:Uncharacterized protein n=1 Tax=Pseudanabaena cinerea FACHB-1277 TaxID=2949581 RepID=A0A926UWT8_9CYAN|nr:hypothetical protein [Pseudanabaena cinerea]MBD2151480.1 hypothetical protein [Pseudanabaena cinerea FACHB-1277]